MQNLEVQAQVQTLLDLGAIYEVQSQPCFLSRIFVVPKDPVGSRLILDVSKLNEYLKIPTFKMSNHSSLSKLLPAPAWMASLDLKDAYLHVPIRSNLHKFLALTCWGKLFFFRALPFGLATAPWLFSSLIEAVLVKLRSKGINILGYIDDLVLWSRSKDELQVHVQETISLFVSLGLTINTKKSNPSPTSSLTWVGVVWDAQKGTWFPKQRNLDEIKSLAIHLRDTQEGSRRQWEKLCGIVAFVAQINRRAKHFSHLISRLSLFNHDLDRDKVVKFHPYLVKGLDPWTRVDSWLTPERFVLPTATTQCWTDASKAGWGILSDQGQAWKGRWSVRQSTLHINVLELLTILYAIRLVLPQDQILTVWSDNQTSISVIQKHGSHSPDLQKLAGQILEICEVRRVHIFPRHIKGSLNVAADALSREEAIPGEWELREETFQCLQRQHGKALQADLFASPLNHKLPVYCCPFQFPLAWAQDALAQDWNSFSQVLIFPPPDLAKEVASKLLSFRGGDTSPPGQSCSPTPLPDPFPVQGTDLRAAAARTRRENHPGIRGVRSLSRLEFLKAVYLLDYEEEVVTDLLGHLAKSSLRQYQSAWKRFQDWLPEATEDISLPLVLKFLVHCNRNLSSSTVLTIRAALSLPLSEGFGIDFEHKHFSMLAKAAFRKKPPAQRVVPSWSLEDALRALARKRTKSNDKLSRFRKALFLVACASSNRASELAAIDRSRVEIRQHSALLPVRPGFLFKNQAQNHTPSLMDIPDLPGSALCPVKALKEYLADTKSSTEPGLFLHPSSGKTLNAGRLAHFLAKAIDWLIPEALGKAHDTRKLSTSRAFCAGISAQQIVAAGSWRSTNTFAKRYFVPALPKAKGSAVVARSRC